MKLPILKVKSTGMDMTPKIGAYLDSKMSQIEKLLPKDETAISLSVELEKITKHHQSGKIFRAEFNLKVAKALFRSEAVAESIEAAIDEAKDEVRAELKKYTAKRTTHVRAGARKAKRLLRE